jgi:hypothetical protein
MRTEDLIRTLAADAGAVRTRPFAPGLLVAALAGGAFWLAILVWKFGAPAQSAYAGWFWMKAAYSVLLAVAGLMATVRLARPGGRVGAVAWLAIATLAWLLMMAGQETMSAGPGQMAHLWLGNTWRICPVRILILAAPVFAGALWMLRSAAPTRLALTGAAAGFFAGAVGAAVYGLYCQETAAAFVVTWYSLGIVACAALGALAGRFLLRW